MLNPLHRVQEGDRPLVRDGGGVHGAGAGADGEARLRTEIRLVWTWVTSQSSLTPDSVGLTYGLAIVTVDVLLEPPVALHLTHLDADSGHLLAPGVRVGLVAVGAVQDVRGGDLLLLLLDLFLSRSLG